MTDNINDALGADNGDAQEPVARSFLNPEEIEERVALFRASLANLDRDPAEAARIDMLIAEANAISGSDLTPFDDPPETKPILDDARQGGTSIVINGSHARPRIAVDLAGHDGPDRGFSLVINGDHAEPRIQAGANQPGQEEDHLAQEREEFLDALAEMRAWVGRKPPRMRGRGTVAVAFLAGASAAIAISSAAIAQIVAITTLAVAPALVLLVIIMPAIFSAKAARREAALSVLGLLLNRGPHPENPPWAGRSGRRLALGGREAGRVDQ